jgi:hypothetical protein
MFVICVMDVKATSSSSSDLISVMNANRFYTNEILTGLVAKSQRLVIEVQKKLKDDEYGTDIKVLAEPMYFTYELNCSCSRHMKSLWSHSNAHGTLG